MAVLAWIYKIQGFLSSIAGVNLSILKIQLREHHVYLFLQNFGSGLGYPSNVLL